MKYPLVDQYSLMQKFNGEINAVRNLGHSPYYISFDREYLYLDNGKERRVLQKTTWGHMPNYFHTVVFYDIYRAARKAIQENDFDLVYFRHSPLNAFGYNMIKTAHDKSKLVVEISSFPPEKEKAKSLIRRAYLAVSAKWWKLSSKYITLFTGIGEYADEYLHRPFLNIDNGIDVSLIPPRAKVNEGDGRLHLLAVASMCKWHGYERVINGFAEWNSDKKGHYIIDLVGDDGDGSLSKWKSRATELGVTEQVIFHGHMTGESLTEMFNKATIGLCSLALYKIGFQTGSVLKLREYMARGLPFVYAHDDPHISDDMPWCLRIPNDDSSIDMEVIDEFVNRIRGRDDLASAMRNYAKTNMSWESQFEKVFVKINDIANQTDSEK